MNFCCECFKKKEEVVNPDFSVHMIDPSIMWAEFFCFKTVFPMQNFFEKGIDKLLRLVLYYG